MEIINDMTDERVIELLNFFEEPGNDSSLILGKEKTEELRREIFLMGNEGYIDVKYDVQNNNRMDPYPISWEITKSGEEFKELN